MPSRGCLEEGLRSCKSPERSFQSSVACPPVSVWCLSFGFPVFLPSPQRREARWPKPSTSWLRHCKAPLTSRLPCEQSRGSPLPRQIKLCSLFVRDRWAKGCRAYDSEKKEEALARIHRGGRKCAKARSFVPGGLFFTSKYARDIPYKDSDCEIEILQSQSK